MATELGRKKAVQAATLKTVMVKECRPILWRFELSREKMNDEEIILTKLKSYFKPTQNILYERYLFHEAAQQPNEMVDQYIIRRDA